MPRYTESDLYRMMTHIEELSEEELNVCSLVAGIMNRHDDFTMLEMAIELGIQTDGIDKLHLACRIAAHRC